MTQKLPVVFALTEQVSWEKTETHQGVFDLSYLRPIPNIVVMTPKDENELRHMLATALDHEGPIAVRYPRGKGIGVLLDEEITSIPIGKAVVENRGADAAYLPLAPMYIQVWQPAMNCRE